MGLMSQPALSSNRSPGHGDSVGSADQAGSSRTGEPFWPNRWPLSSTYSNRSASRFSPPEDPISNSRTGARCSTGRCSSPPTSADARPTSLVWGGLVEPLADCVRLLLEQGQERGGAPVPAPRCRRHSGSRRRAHQPAARAPTGARCRAGAATGPTGRGRPRAPAGSPPWARRPRCRPRAGRAARRTAVTRARHTTPPAAETSSPVARPRVSHRSGCASCVTLSRQARWRCGTDKPREI